MQSVIWLLKGYELRIKNDELRVENLFSSRKIKINKLLQIHLKNIRFFSYHGIFEEERILGNNFIVNITVDVVVETLPVLHMKQSIDYVAIYELVAQRMAKATPLLETVATEIAQTILARYSLAIKVEISIDKITPPIPSFVGSVGVSFTLERE